MTLKNYILVGISFCVAALAGTMAGYVDALRDIKKTHQQYEHIEKKQATNKTNPSFTMHMEVNSADNTTNVDTAVSLTGNVLKYQQNGNTFYFDSNTLFGEQCKGVFSNFDEKDTEPMKHFIVATYIYKHRNVFADWCAPTNMSNYLLDVDKRFGQDYKKSMNYLDAKMNNKAEKCFIQTTLAARKHYDFAEFNADFEAVKQILNLRNKRDLCRMLNESKDLRDIWLDTIQEDIQKLKTVEMSGKLYGITANGKFYEKK